MLDWYKAVIIIISLKINLFSPWYSCKIAHLSLNNNHSLNWWFSYLQMTSLVTNAFRCAPNVRGLFEPTKTTKIGIQRIKIHNMYIQVVTPRYGSLYPEQKISPFSIARYWWKQKNDIISRDSIHLRYPNNHGYIVLLTSNQLTTRQG